MTRLRKVCILISAFILLTALCGCGGNEDEVKARYDTVTLNTANNFFCNGTVLEANARELTYDGNDASVRIRITNIGDDPVESVDANVRFLDADGNMLFERALHQPLAEKLYKDETFTVNIDCSGENVRRITSVNVVEWTE